MNQTSKLTESLIYKHSEIQRKFKINSTKTEDAFLIHEPNR